MRCTKAHKLIGEYLEGTLGPDEKARLQGHLDSCEDCRSLLKDFEEIVEESKSLPRREPSNRVWEGILAGVRAGGFKAIEPGKGKVRRPALFPFPARVRFAWAAAALAVVIIGGGLAIGLLSRRDAGGPLRPDKYTLAKLDEAEKYYKLAIRSLDDAIASQKTKLDPQIAAVFARNLKEIDAAIQNCQAAVSREPNNVEARLYLLGAYKDKVDFLDNIIDVKKESPSASATGKTL
jgi:tetratricopeptide (TPR) repeat protein